jgi:hypothetical protein
VNRDVLLRDCKRGLSINQLAKEHAISKASACRILKQAKTSVSEGLVPALAASSEDKVLMSFKKTA